MKKFLCLSMLCVALSGYAQVGACYDQSDIISDQVRFCESTYPYQDGILIANFGTEQLNPLNTEGKGYILYHSYGENKVLIPADGYLSAPKGMFLRENHLFICDVNKIVVYQLDNLKRKPQVIQMPAGDLFVNDLVASENDLFVSVTNTNKIYKLDISNLDKIGSPVEWLNISGPNGLLLDDGIMYVASYPADGQTTEAHVIYRITDLKNPSPEKFITVPGQYDGIAFSTDHKSLYITNWVPAGISKVNLETREITPVSVPLDKALIGPADITVRGAKIYIPDLPNSRVVVVNE